MTIKDHLIRLLESGEMSEDEYAPEVTLPVDFNQWMKEVDKDKDYIAKREAAPSVRQNWTLNSVLTALYDIIGLQGTLIPCPYH